MMQGPTRVPLVFHIPRYSRAVKALLRLLVAVCRFLHDPYVWPSVMTALGRSGSLV